MKDETKKALMTVLESSLDAEIAKIETLTGQEATIAVVRVAAVAQLTYANKDKKQVNVMAQLGLGVVTNVGSDTESVSPMSAAQQQGPGR